MDAQVANRLSDLGIWAQQRPGIRRLWIFGSRARGTHRPDSDLDIAFEIDRLPTDQAAEEFQTQVRPSWMAELSALFGLKVHLEPMVGDATNVASYVRDSGELAYDRVQR
jgi:predicted nucleotidyltransferase